MNTAFSIHDFDDIRPFLPEELPAAYERLSHDEQFLGVVGTLYPHVPVEQLVQLMRQQKTNIDFQKTFAYPLLKQLMGKLAHGWEMDATAVDTSRRFTFISNHRDIVMDPALLSVLLIDTGFETTVEIAIGDNLLAAPWILDLVRINKSFIVRRSPGIREQLLASKQLSEYMHYVVNQKNDNVWIAQREGRAKDGNDQTQPAVLKMMAMGGEGSAVERLQQLHLVPLAISYEVDPCDFLKAKEFQQRRDDPSWRKQKADDVLSMRTGIMGPKGYVHYHCAPCIDEWLAALPADTPKGELFNLVAAHIDHEIHRHYRIFDTNRAALLTLQGGHDARFEEFLQSRIALIDLPEKDEGFLRQCLIEMYANPLRNHLKSKEQ